MTMTGADGASAPKAWASQYQAREEGGESRRRALNLES